MIYIFVLVSLKCSHNNQVSILFVHGVLVNTNA